MKNTVSEVWMSTLIVLYIFVFGLGLTYLITSHNKVFDKPPLITDNVSFYAPIDNTTSSLNIIEKEEKNDLIDEIDSANTIKETQEAIENIEETVSESFVACHYKGNLHVRSGPSLESDIVTSLKPGDFGIILEQKDEWSLISFEQNGQTITGYVFNQYIKILIDGFPML